MASMASLLKMQTKGISMEDVLIPVAVGGVQVASAFANDEINKQLAAQGKPAMGPFLNAKTLERAGVVAVTAIAALAGKEAAVKSAGKVGLHAAIPGMMEALVFDTMAVMKAGGLGGGTTQGIVNMGSVTSPAASVQGVGAGSTAVVVDTGYSGAPNARGGSLY